MISSHWNSDTASSRFVTSQPSPLDEIDKTMPGLSVPFDPEFVAEHKPLEPNPHHRVPQILFLFGRRNEMWVRVSLGPGGGERGEVVVAELRAEAVLQLVPGAGVIDADPGRRFQSRPQHSAGFVEEGALARVQQAHDLALGDRDAERPELGNQARHGDLALMVLQQHEAAQLRPDAEGRAKRSAA